MKICPSRVTAFCSDTDGASAVEYAILVAAIATVIVVVTLIVGRQIENAFNMLCKAVGNISGGVSC